MNSPHVLQETSTPERYGWINAIALALSAMIALMSIRAYGDVGAPLKAWVCVMCQALAIALAILARRGLTGAMPWAGAAAALGALGCAWWASHGLALAWAQNGDRANGWMVFFLAALEPALFLLAEHIREGRIALRQRHEGQAEGSMTQPVVAPKTARVTPFRRARAAVRVAAVGAAALGATHGALTPGALAPDAPVAHSATATDMASRKAAALDLLRVGALSHRAIAARVGVSARTVDRLAQEVG